jgi:hypothetical protein
MRNISVFYTDQSNNPLRYSLAKAVESTGILRLSERVIFRLFTGAGAAYGQPSFGNSFIENIRKGLYRTTTSLQQGFSVARLQLLKQAAIDEADDETTMVDIELLAAAIVADTVDLRLRITSKSGGTAVFDVEV